MYVLKPAELKLLGRNFERIAAGLSAHERWAVESLGVRNKQGLIVPYVLQPAQIKFNSLIESQRARKKPVRIIVLKARQVMISTATAAQFFQRVAFDPGQRAVVVAHEEKAAKNIFGYYSVFDESYLPGREGFGKLSTVRDARIGGMIEYAGGGYIHVATANNLKTGRSFTLRFLHLSEYAFWRNARTLMTGLMQAVPDDPDTMVVKESTANGVGGAFHQDWLEACAGGSDWEPMFFGWWEHPEYSRAVAYPDQFQASLSREEQDEQTRYHLTLEQLHWRRWCIKNNCQGSVSIFHQEYPSNPEEAFVASGRPRFSLPSLARMPVIRDADVGELEELQNGPKKVLAFLPGEGGALTIYKRPAEGQQYVIGVDVAEGIDINEATLGNPDPDYTVFHISNRNGEQVAKLRARIEPSPAGEYCALLGRYYNWAFIVPESNGPGIAFLDSLLRCNYPPGLIYHRKPLPDEQFVEGRDHSTSQYLGWRQNQVTRVQLLSTHDQCIRELAVIFHDPQTISEHQTFVIKPNGKAEHNEGCHDDEVIAAALATIGVLHPPPDRKAMGLQRPAPTNLVQSGTHQRYGQRPQEERGRLFKP